MIFSYLDDFLRLVCCKFFCLSFIGLHLSRLLFSRHASKGLPTIDLLYGLLSGCLNRELVQTLSSYKFSSVSLLSSLKHSHIFFSYSLVRLRYRSAIEMTASYAFFWKGNDCTENLRMSFSSRSSLRKVNILPFKCYRFTTTGVIQCFSVSAVNDLSSNTFSGVCITGNLELLSFHINSNIKAQY